MSRSGAPYFAPIPDSVTNPKPSAERQHELWTIEDLVTEARRLGGFHAAHTPDEYARAATLYEEATTRCSALGGRSSDVQLFSHLARSCRERSGAGR